MTSVTEEMIEAAQARLTDDRLQEILAATQGVTRGPWQVYTKEHPWALPEREFLGGKFPASTGTHKERFVITTWVHPQVKAEPTVIGGSVGVGVDGPVHMVHIEEADAAHIANCDPQTIAALVTELQSARAALEAALSASPAAQAEVVEQAEGWESALHGAMISRIMPETSSDMTFAEAEALGADLLGLIRTYAPSAPQPTEPVAVKLDRDALAELLSRAGAPPGPPDGPIRALPENHFERVRAYKQADAVLSALASPVAQQRDEGWQDIATAPKDGTWFLGWKRSPHTEEQFDVWQWDANAETETGYGFWVNAADSNLDDYPTHWRPLPQPPVLSPERKDQSNG